MLSLSSVASNESRLSSALTAANRIILRGVMRALTLANIFAQRLNLDGSLGNIGDIDDNGTVNVDDLLGVITNWGPCPQALAFCAGDVAPLPVGGGSVNIDDVLAVITNWG